MPFKIDSISAFIAIDDQGEEGICSFKNGDTWIPLIMADETWLIQMRPIAEQIARQTGKEIKLIRFSQRTECETIT